jgi:Fe-S-cluster containining protein
VEGAVNRVKGAGATDQLVQIVDQAMAEAVRKSGSWLACRIGCHECCLGPFPITQLDGLRLRAGLAELETREPERAARVLGRASASVERLRREFPENPVEAVLALEEAAGDEPCPALDPETGACDLYVARPITCRMFGPAVREPGGGSVSVCHLCFQGATDEEIAACAVEIDPVTCEESREDTIVAFALVE